MDGGESIDASVIGSADEVVQERVCDDELIVIRGTKARTAASIIIRGANDFMCDEIERSIHDALCGCQTSDRIETSRSRWWML